jgi:hypothetical protein
MYSAPMRSPMTRRQLVITIARLQNMIGKAKGIGGNDRNPNRYAEFDAELREAFDLCLEAVGAERPVSSSELKNHEIVFPILKRGRI